MLWWKNSIFRFNKIKWISWGGRNERKINWISWKEYLRSDIPQFKAGDTIGVYYKVKEGNKERVQLFEGVVIRVNGGGVAKTFTVRKSYSRNWSRKE